MSIRLGAGTSRLGSTGQRLIAIAAAVAIVVTGTTIATTQPAFADEYPTWADVAAARNNEAATAAAVAQIEGMLAGLKAEAERTQADADAKSTIWIQLDQKFQAAAARTDTLQAQADAANVLATASEQRAGQIAAQLMRGGGQDVTTNLLLSTGDADNLLYGLGMSDKVAAQADAIIARAQFDRNTAQAQTDAAEVAKRELEILQAAAAKALEEAQAASLAAATALQEQLDHQALLQQQLVVLKEKRAATEADYLAGVQARIDAGASLGAGEISLSGWAKPAGGHITSGFGGRNLYGDYNFHTGTDLANPCGTPIYAAHSGTVVISSYEAGGFGNYIIIDHGNGIRTAYGHIIDGGRMVSAGQHVDVGQQIARVGSTGNSTGCHLHFEVRNPRAIDAQPFMAAQGVPLG